MYAKINSLESKIQPFPLFWLLEVIISRVRGNLGTLNIQDDFVWWTICIGKKSKYSILSLILDVDHSGSQIQNKTTKCFVPPNTCTTYI